MSVALYTCSTGRRPVVLNPPLSHRIGADGQAMKRAEALSLFRDSKGGRCADCYLAHRDQRPLPVRRSWPSLAFPDKPSPLDWATLRTS